MKLGTKISMGFGTLLAIVVVLGGIAIWQMWRVQSESCVLATEYIPAVEVSADTERASLLTMYEMRGYGLSENEGMLARAREHLAEVKKKLEEASVLGERSLHVTELKSVASESRAKTDEYEKLVEQTVAGYKAIDADRAALDAAAKEYMEACDAFLRHQRDMMHQELGGTNAAHSGRTVAHDAAGALSLIHI